MSKNEKKTDFSKITIKNSFYSLSFTILSKIGGLFLTIILARLLMPELFGIYSLALSVASISIIFMDFGTEITGIRYLSDALGKNNKKKARSFFRFLLKIRLLLAATVILALILLSKPLANSFFQKPIILFPIIFSSFYIFIESIRSFFGICFIAKNNLKPFPLLEILHQVLKITLVISLISTLSLELKISGVFIALAISGIILFFVQLFIIMRTDKELILGKVAEIDKKKILGYMGFAGLSGITLVFFGSVDTLMLGRFVGAEYIGYYRAALGIVVSLSTLLSFGGILLPIFTRLNGKRLDRGFEKSFRYLIIIAIPTFIGLVFISKFLILLLYGESYLLATSSLLVLSLLILVSPINSLYSSIFQAREKPKILAKFIVIALILNIILNYILIKMFLNIGQEYALIGSGLATLLSNIFLMIALVIKGKSNFKLETDKNPIIKSIFATAIMLLFLLFFSYLFGKGLLSNIIMVLLGIVVYFSFMFLIKGITKEDIGLFKKISS